MVLDTFGLVRPELVDPVYPIAWAGAVSEADDVVRGE
jgi:hypothetical protein